MTSFDHAIAIVFALLAVGAGVLILVLTKAASTPGIAAGVVLIVLGMFAAIPANMVTAREQLSSFWKSYKNPEAQEPKA